jgi:hypothetical protein
MAKAAILQTIVTPDGDGTVVQLQISDAPLLDESAAIRIALTVRVGAYDLPLLAHLEREALEVALRALRDLSQAKASEIVKSSHSMHPEPSKPSG